jgi:hypothetical protein
MGPYLKIIKEKRSGVCGSSGRVPIKQTQDPEFKPQYRQKKKKKRKKELIGLINAAPASILPLSILKNSESKPDPKLSNKELCHSQGFHFLSDCAQTRPSS